MKVGRLYFQIPKIRMKLMRILIIMITMIIFITVLIMDSNNDV